MSAGLAGLLVSGLAIAALSPLIINVGVDGTGLLTVQTDAMPKGWFSSRNTFDRSTSNVQTVYALGATSCSAEKTGGTLNSTVDGGFTSENNPQGAPIAYYYAVSKDLSPAQNHWYNHQHCDGSIEVHGCPQAIPVTVTATAYDKNGACHTYTDNSGVTRCAADTQSASLGAVQDPDVIDTQCAELNCGIGQCVSSCEHAPTPGTTPRSPAVPAARPAATVAPPRKRSGSKRRRPALQLQAHPPGRLPGRPRVSRRLEFSHWHRTRPPAARRVVFFCAAGRRLRRTA